MNIVPTNNQVQNNQPSFKKCITILGMDKISARWNIAQELLELAEDIKPIAKELDADFFAGPCCEKALPNGSLITDKFVFATGDDVAYENKYHFRAFLGKQDRIDKRIMAGIRDILKRFKVGEDEVKIVEQSQWKAGSVNTLPDGTTQVTANYIRPMLNSVHNFKVQKVGLYDSDPISTELTTKLGKKGYKSLSAQDYMRARELSTQLND